MGEVPLYASSGVLRRLPWASPCTQREREFFTENLLVRIYFIIGMIRWTGLAPWEFEFHFPGSLTSACLVPALTPTFPGKVGKMFFAKVKPFRCFQGQGHNQECS